MTCERLNKIPRKVFLWGGTGQAKIARPIIEAAGGEVIAVFDDTADLLSPFSDVRLYHGGEFADWACRQDPESIGFCIAIGNPHGEIRLALAEKCISFGFSPVTIAHPAATIADNAQIGVGAQISAGAIIGPEVALGRQCIVNANASIDHECRLGDGVEIAPGTTLCGCIAVEDYAWVGAGATVLPHLRIGRNSIVGAGAVVVRDVPENSVVVGVPAKVLRHR